MKKTKKITPTKVLLINPPYTASYTDAKVKGSFPITPSLPVATIIPYIANDDVEVFVLDLQIVENPIDELKKVVYKVSPDVVGITFLTPSHNFVMNVVKIVKEHDDDIIVIGGGPHISTFPEESLKELFDIVFLGEAELALQRFFLGEPIEKIDGVGFKDKNGKIVVNRIFRRITDLDDLKYPIWKYFDLKKYVTSKTYARKNPAGWMESSRGCFFNCDFCNKNIFGYKFRAKSPERVVDEMEYMLSEGFKDINIADDGFSTDLVRAKKICNLIIERKLDFSWQLGNGIRCDRFDKELAGLLVKAGCYNVSFGVESANQDILDACGKGVKLSTIENAIKTASDAGLHTTGFFMFGFPGETEDSMEKTIQFAIKSGLNLAKLAILLPLPGTKRFNEWDNAGLIKSKDWSKYNTHRPDEVYTHPSVKWDSIYHYYDQFYKRFYLRPSFMLSRLKTGLIEGTLLDDAKVFLKTKF